MSDKNIDDFLAQNPNPTPEMLSTFLNSNTDRRVAQALKTSGDKTKELEEENAGLKEKLSSYEKENSRQARLDTIRAKAAGRIPESFIGLIDPDIQEDKIDAMIEVFEKEIKSSWAAGAQEAQKAARGMPGGGERLGMEDPRFWQRLSPEEGMKHISTPEGLSIYRRLFGRGR